MEITSYLLGKKAGGSGATTNYNDLTNKPSINGVELVSDKSTSDLGLFDLITEQEINAMFPEALYIDLEDGNWYNGHSGFIYYDYTTEESYISNFLANTTVYGVGGTFTFCVNNGMEEEWGECIINTETKATGYIDGTPIYLFEYKEIEESGETFMALVKTFIEDEEEVI